MDHDHLAGFKIQYIKVIMTLLQTPFGMSTGERQDNKHWQNSLN